MILGVLAIVYAAFLLVQDAPNANSSNIPRIVGYDAIIALAGAIIFIMGVVIQGFKNIFALIVHLIALIPYYLAITKVQTLGQQGTSDFSTYLTQTELYWAVAIILGIVGIILNRVGRKKKQAMPPQTQPTQPMPPPQK
jgi:ABC-type branched-subunit amino acid transport system permease subunit